MADNEDEDLPELLRGMDEEEREDAMATMGPGELRVAPEDKYRVLGTDAFAPPTEPDWVVGDFDTEEEALRVAREKNKAAAGGKILDEDDGQLTMINRYFAYDDEGSYIGGDVHKGE